MIQKATFAGGCFWCMVTPFDQLPGIHGIISGYMGGHVENPTYEQVLTGETGHHEVVQITFDSSIFPYEKLLELYWPQIDPTDPNGQGNDQKSQYKTAIFYHNEEQRLLAEQSKQQIAGRFDKPIATEIKPAVVFYEAEEYHQDFHRKDPEYYKESRIYSGRDVTLERVWGDKK